MNSLLLQFNSRSVGRHSRPQPTPPVRRCKNTIGPLLRLQRERLRFLSCVAGNCFTSHINTQLPRTTRAKLVLRQHSHDSFAYQLFGTSLQEQPNWNLFQPARIPAVMTINLLIDLVAGEPDLLRVDHDHVIAAIRVRSESRLILADQDPRDACRQAAEHLSVRVHHEPVLAFRQFFRFTTLGTYVRIRSAHLSLQSTNVESKLER